MDSGLQVSTWVTRHLPLLATQGEILDLACGSGRHLRYCLGLGHTVVGIDIDLSGVQDLWGNPRVELVEFDIEGDRPWIFAERQFSAIIGCNYLFRPVFADLMRSLQEGGLLIYETFARGNEQFGRPRNPEYLLAPGELFDLLRGQSGSVSPTKLARLHVLSYEHGFVRFPKPAIVQRICAVRLKPDAEIPCLDLCLDL